MKKCELCSLQARIYCESDQASLCWDCEGKVHGANFLVAKHTRSLLCHVCQSPTPWKASGPKLTPTVSVCESCVDNNTRKCERGRQDESQGGNYEDDEEEEEDDDEVDMFSSDNEAEDDEDFDEEEDEDGDNQVVPWSSSSSLPPPPVASSSSSEEEGFSASKRMRENADLDSDDEIGCSFANDDATSSHPLKPLKRPRITEAFQSARSEDHGQEESRSTAIINSLQRLQNNVITDDDHASATILGICKLCRDQNS